MSDDTYEKEGKAMLITIDLFGDEGETQSSLPDDTSKQLESHHECDELELEIVPVLEKKQERINIAIIKSLTD